MISFNSIKQTWWRSVRVWMSCLHTVRRACVTLLTDDVNTHLDRPTGRARSRVPRGKHTGSCPPCLHSHLHGTAEGSSHTHRCLTAIRTHKDSKHRYKKMFLVSWFSLCRYLFSDFHQKAAENLLKLSGWDMSCSRLWNICRSKFPFVRLRVMGLCPSSSTSYLLLLSASPLCVSAFWLHQCPHYFQAQL